MAKTQEITLNGFQRLDYVQIAPKGSLVAISGRNAQGKSSVLDGLEATIIGHNKRDVPRPVHEGKKAAENIHVLDNGMQLIRKYKADGSSTLTGKTADGTKVAQATLNGMLGALGMDAGAFPLLDDKKQLAAVLNLVDLPFDPAELALDRKQIFEERTRVNTRVGDFEAQLKQYEEFPDDLPAAEVSVSELLDQYRAGQEVNTKISNTVRSVQHWESEAERLKRELADVERKAVEASEDASKLPEEVDLAEIQLKIDGAEETNRLVRKKQERGSLQFQYEATAEQAKALTQKIADIDKKKSDGLAAANFPVPGMSFDDEGVLLHGRPFRKASTREQTIASARLIIASKPELKVMIIRNGSDLDNDGIQELQNLGDENGFQIWVEFVDESGEFGWTIEDGKIA
ncbi:hypothetical protein [Glutamicibacter sp. 2E12]|uniref:hypothetical protein n=1 Tax=Glutamicibacter sp. 2E12 TaxID=3416181 RepID=UPI003CF11D96